MKDYIEDEPITHLDKLAQIQALVDAIARMPAGSYSDAKVRCAFEELHRMIAAFDA